LQDFEQLKKEKIQLLEEKAVLESYRRQLEDLPKDIHLLEKWKEELELDIRELGSKKTFKYRTTELDEAS
jgi:hypothetical protein